MVAPLWAFLMAAAINVAVSWGNINGNPRPQTHLRSQTGIFVCLHKTGAETIGSIVERVGPAVLSVEPTLFFAAHPVLQRKRAHTL